MRRSSTTSVTGLLLCLGSLPAAAQDNPWRVPTMPAQGGRQSTTIPEQPPAAPARGMPWDNGAATGTLPHQQNIPLGNRGGSYAALPRNELQSGRRTMTDSGDDYGYSANGFPPLAPEYSPPHQQPSDTAAIDRQTPPQPEMRFGEFPPLDGAPPPPKPKNPYAEGTLSPLPGARPPAPAQQNSGYAYGGYGAYSYAPYGQYRDPMWSGPSVLSAPWGGYGGGAYGGPYGYGLGSPSPYGW